MMIETSFSLVLIISPLSDEFGQELAQTAAKDTLAGVILIVQSQLVDEISSKVEDSGVLVLPRSLNQQIFFSAVKMMTVVHRRLAMALPQTEKLQNKIEEIRLVDRAKCLLIQYLQYTEQQAHRYIEKQAMDQRKTRKEIAREIIRDYED